MEEKFYDDCSLKEDDACNSKELAPFLATCTDSPESS